MILHKGKWLNLVSNKGWEWVERAGNTKSVVVIIPTTLNKEVVLIEQRREPVGMKVIEFPAGLVGDKKKGESCLVAAQRELLEETGYLSDILNFNRIVTVPTSPGLTSELVTFYHAKYCLPVQQQEPNPDEHITVHVIKYGNIDLWLQNQASAGKLISVKVFAGLHLLQARGFAP